MNNLVQVNHSVSVREKRNELSMMLKKVVIKLSRDEFEVLEQLFLLWINTKKCNSLEDKAIYVLIFVNLYRNKIMPQMFKVTRKLTLNLSLPESYALDYMLSDIYLEGMVYEQILSQGIIAEINRQTV
jgi:hypothetical protein